MTKKIFRSICTVTVVVLVASIILATTFLYGYFNKTQSEQLRDELSFIAQTVNDSGMEFLNHFQSESFRLSLIDKNGEVLYDSEADSSEMENHKDREEIKEAFNSGTGSSSRYSSTLAERTFYEAVKLKDGSVLRISVSSLTIGALLVVMLPSVCVILIIALLIAFLLSHIMAKRITEPINKLDLEHPADNNAYEELSPVLTRINKQNKKIKAQMEALHQKSDEFEQIIASMNEGFVLLNEQGVVLSMNKAAEGIFSVDKSAVGKDFLSVDRSNEMRNAVNNALSGEKIEFREERKGFVYQFNLSRIQSNGKILGAVILVFDITDKAKGEQNRREFTANVSHELKTPLQSIIGSAELLENGLVKPEDTGKFVGNIKKEASRLVVLINDIIRLSQLDEEAKPVAENINLLSVAQEVADVLEDSAKQKSVTVKVKGESCNIEGVERYIYEILYNLCDNAIRYNKDGGSVTIDIHKEDEHPVIVVSDNGIGIPTEHQGRIFERFYRVDKSHSKETGGTGLGLSIVKHAVQFHGGKIHLESEMGKGTSVKVIF